MGSSVSNLAQHLNSSATAGRLGGPGHRLYGAVVQKLGFEIVSGYHAPGAVLSGEVKLAEELKVSRGSVREALQVLSSKGLIVSQPRRGTRVAARCNWNILDPEILRWAFMGKPDVQLVRDMFEIRSTIEPVAAALAAQRRTSDDISIMKHILASMRRRNFTHHSYFDTDRDFHDSVLRAAGNAAITALSPGICASITWLARLNCNGRKLPRDPVPETSKVIEAIWDRDALGARSGMETIIALSFEDAKEILHN